MKQEGNDGERLLQYLDCHNLPTTSQKTNRQLGCFTQSKVSTLLVGLKKAKGRK